MRDVCRLETGDPDTGVDTPRGTVQDHGAKVRSGRSGSPTYRPVRRVTGLFLWLKSIIMLITPSNSAPINVKGDFTAETRIAAGSGGATGQFRGSIPDSAFAEGVVTRCIPFGKQSIMHM